MRHTSISAIAVAKELSMQLVPGDWYLTMVPGGFFWHMCFCMAPLSTPACSAGDIWCTPDMLQADSVQITHTTYRLRILPAYGLQVKHMQGMPWLPQMAHVAAQLLLI